MKKILKVFVLVLLCTGFTIGSLYAKQGAGTETNPNIMPDQYIDDGYAGGGIDGGEAKEETKIKYQLIPYTTILSNFDAQLNTVKDFYMVGDELKLSGPRDVVESGFYSVPIPAPKPEPKPESEPDNHICQPRRVVFIDPNGHQFFCIWDHDDYRPHNGNPCLECKYNNPNWTNPHLGS